MNSSTHCHLKVGDLIIRNSRDCNTSVASEPGDIAAVLKFNSVGLFETIFLTGYDKGEIWCIDIRPRWHEYWDIL